MKTQVFEEDWRQSDIDALLRLQLSKTVGSRHTFVSVNTVSRGLLNVSGKLGIS